MPPRRAAAAQPHAGSSLPRTPLAETPLFLPGLDSSSDSDTPSPPPQTPLPPAPPSRPATPLPRPAAPATAAAAAAAPTNYDSDSSTSSATSSTGGDPVVRTFDIHVTATHPPNLHIFQYPVRSRHKPYRKAAASCPVEARLKPRSGMIEVDVPVNVHANYDEEKGRAWGDVLRRAKAKDAVKAVPVGTGGKRRKVRSGAGSDEDGDEGEGEEDVMHMEFEEAVRAGRVLDRQTLGSKMQGDNTKYMVGVFKGDKLHLTPVSSTLQLRPQFHHVDTQLDQERALTKALREPPHQKPEARAIQLSVKNAEDPSSQLSSTMKALRIAEEEAWTKLHWVDQDMDEAWEMYANVCLKDGDEAGWLKCVTSKKEYVEWLGAGKPIVKQPKEVGVKKEG